MAEQDPNRYLSQISTCWSAVGRAHMDLGEGVEAARRALLERYSGAVYRYLHGALRDAPAAEDLYQEFALLFLRGDFRRAAPERGRFRDYVKTALWRLVARHCACRHAGPRTLAIDVADPAPAAPDQADQEFVRSWRSELLSRAWQALERFEERTGRPFYQVLRLRVEQPDASSDQLAALLSAQLGKCLTAAAARQALHRAREVFADLLLDEVTGSLADPTADAVEQELADLGLLEYCRPALARPRTSSRPAGAAAE
jgi:RNA polymerase sigma-70 factor (ECF subfamily)